MKNVLGVPKVNVIDDKPLFKQMHSNAKYNKRSPIGGKDNHKIIQQIINGQNVK